MADLTLNADTLKTAFDNLDNKEKTAFFGFDVGNNVINGIDNFFV
jgi:hypothetical protein